MSLPEPSFSIGIEEEYMLVDRETRDLVSEPPPSMMAICEAQLGDQVSPEFLKSQIEVGTKVARNVGEAREDLIRLRRCIAGVADAHGLAPIAASTHPFARWGKQHHTDKERYNALAQDLQGVVRRLLISGMHVHVGIDDDELRMDLMNQISYFLPHLLALSTSSPFWGGQDTGLKSYRIAVWHEMPRTGLPEQFDSFSEYQRHVDVLVKTGVIEDATKLWWDVRPSARFPTLEVRIADLCPRLEDTVCIAALYVCLLRMLWRLRRQNQRWRRYAPMLVTENRWRAQRYGIDEGLIDFGVGAIVPYADLLEEMIELTAPDAEALDCVEELAHARTILTRGTSAHRQVALYNERVAAGDSAETALQAVVDQLIAETMEDVGE